MNASLRMCQGLSALATISLACMSLATALVGTSAAQAFAPQTGTTRYVKAGVSGSSTSGCATATLTTVQAAVTAAVAGDTVYLCGTTPFAEEVIINKSLTVSGDAGATLKAPASYPLPATVLPKLPTKFTTDGLFVPETVLFIWGTGVNVTVNAITVSGVMPTNGVCNNDEYGILAIAGAALTLNGTTVKDIYDSNSTLYSCQFGVGIQVGRSHWGLSSNVGNTVPENFAATATITGVTVSHSQKNNITVDGVGSTGDVTNSTITGFGRDLYFAPAIASNGIQFSRGATGQIIGNTVTGMDYTGPASASAAGIIVYGGCGDANVTNVKIQYNTLTNNDIGVDAENYSADPACNVAATTPTNILICSNTISNDQVTNKGPETIGGHAFAGYQAGILEIGNTDTIIYNLISGNGYLPKRTTPAGPYTTDIDTTTAGASISPAIITSLQGPTATAAPVAQQAFVRFVESSTAYASLDVALDKKSVITNVGQCTASGYIPVASGTHSVTIFAPSGGAPVSISFATFTAGAYYTVALVGNPPTVAPAAVIFTDDLAVDPSQAKVRVYHLSDASGPLTVTQGSTTLASALAFKAATGYDMVAPGTVTYTLKENNPPNTSTPDALSVAANKVYSIFWMCGTKTVNVGTAGIPKGLPNTGGLNLPANFTWLVVGLVLVLLIGGGTALRIITTRRTKVAA